MNMFMIYMLKAAIYLAGFYIIYFTFLSRDTFYNRNRLFLLVSILLSFIMPFFAVKTQGDGTISYFGRILSEIIVTGEKPVSGGSLLKAPILTDGMLARIYIAGLCLFGIKLVADTGSLLFLIIRQGDRKNRIIYFNRFNTAGFSAMGYIFINHSITGDEAEEITRHEKNHLYYNHFADILFIEIIKVLQWFNPVVHLINRSLRAIHEYQADEECIRSGISVLSYQNLLLSNIFRSKIFIPSNSFSNPSLIQKRIIMLSKRRSGSLASMKILLAAPVIIFTILIISACENSINAGKIETENAAEKESLIEPSANPAGIPETMAVRINEITSEGSPLPPPPPPPEASETIENESETTPVEFDTLKTGEELKPENVVPTEVFVVVEEMPSFPGGETSLMEFIYNNITYPDYAKTEGIEGRVIIRFCVTYQGSIDQVTVLKGVHPSIDNEAVRVIKMLPRWRPGRQGGKEVNVWFSVPVTFQLK